MIFDLLIALLNSRAFRNKVSGSENDGLRWRKRYLELTYTAGSYRPYDVAGACSVGMPVFWHNRLKMKNPDPQIKPMYESARLYPILKIMRCSLR